MAERADVGALRAADTEHVIAVFLPEIVDGMNGYAPCLTIHLPAAAGDVVELLAVDFNGAVHRRDLLDLAGKAPECCADILFRR